MATLDVELTYKRMLLAAVKAEEASNNYNGRDAYIDVWERANYEWSRPGASKQNLQRIIDDYKEQDRKLSNAFNRYNFWRREQMRLGSLLQAHEAYLRLQTGERRA